MMKKLPKTYKVYDFYRTQVYLGSDLWVPVSLTHSLSLVDLIDLSLVDKDPKSSLNSS